MTVLANIDTTLGAYSNLTDLISTRFYAIEMPQTPTFPNVVYFRNSTRVENDLDSLAKENPTIQIDCRAVTYASARAIAEQVKAAMQNATLFKALLINDIDLPKEDSANVYRISLDFSVW